MIRSEIKSKVRAAKVAQELVKDLIKELVGTYEVKLENVGMYYDVVVTSPKGCCNILTSSCIDRIMRVANMYQLQYNNVCYSIDVVEEEETHFPAFIIQVTYSK